MRETPNARFIAVLLGFALTGAALLWSIPALFRPHEPSQVWTTAGLGSLAIILAVGILYRHPTKSPRAKRNMGAE